MARPTGFGTVDFASFSLWEYGFNFLSNGRVHEPLNPGRDIMQGATSATIVAVAIAIRVGVFRNACKRITLRHRHEQYAFALGRSEEHTSELQSRGHLV